MYYDIIVNMKNIAHLEALKPFSIAIALLVFTLIPSSASAATTYYIDIPNLSSYGNGYNSGYISGYGSNPNNYPNYTYQYYRNPNPNSSSCGYQNCNSGNYSGGIYTPMKVNYTPYNFPSYSQYIRQADGTFRLVPQVVPAYAWNADYSLPSSMTGVYGTGQYGGSGRGFIMTSGY